MTARRRGGSRDPLARLRKLCLSLPEAREVIAWGEPTWRVKTMFAMHANAGTHHGSGREAVWVKALMVNQELMVSAAPDRFFVPPYAGAAGWVGVWIDSAKTDWDELEELLWDAWRMSASEKLVARFPDGSAAKEPPTRKSPKASERSAPKQKAVARRKARTKA